MSDMVEPISRIVAFKMFTGEDKPEADRTWEDYQRAVRAAVIEIVTPHLESEYRRGYVDGQKDALARYANRHHETGQQ